MYVTFCCLHGKTIQTKCNLKVVFSLNSWIYNKINNNYTVDRTGLYHMVVIGALVQIYFGSVQSIVKLPINIDLTAIIV